MVLQESLAAFATGGQSVIFAGASSRQGATLLAPDRWELPTVPAGDPTSVPPWDATSVPAGDATSVPAGELASAGARGPDLRLASLSGVER
ncbi:MAG: hypothetical protein R2715_12270 [Ilumatobacteraceae bacterium]